LPNIRLDIKGLVLAGSTPMVVVEQNTVAIFDFEFSTKKSQKQKNVILSG